jgi:glycolate oxidase iron-sulfur subunit
MRAVADGVGDLDESFMTFMDLCLVCRACEDVCPSHVPFGRMMERARVQVEPLRPSRVRSIRRLGLDVVLSRPWMVWLAALLQPLAEPFLARRTRALVPSVSPRELFRRLPLRTDPPAGKRARGTVAILSGCVQDRWFRHVNRATIRVLARNGWQVVVPRGQTCCGALAAHNGNLEAARRAALRNVRAFAGADEVVVNAAGCSAHMKTYEELTDGPMPPVRDLMEFLDHEGLTEAPTGGIGTELVAYHDACHALRAQKIHDQPRRLLRKIPGLEIVEIPNGDRCCGAAGLYNVTQPDMSSALMRQKAEAVVATGARVVASANPGCTMQLLAGLRELGADVDVLHPIELLDRAYVAKT